MLMEPVSQFNNLSKELRAKLVKRVEGFGPVVRYRFKISRENPDPDKYNGKIIYPRQYTLDPAIFTIKDEYEKTEGKSKLKQIAIVEALDKSGIPEKFGRVKVYGNEKGILTLNIDKREEDLAMAMFLELHPKVGNGMFPDSESFHVVERIDEVAYAKEQREVRSKRLEALSSAQRMSDAEIREFNSAMGWDESRDTEVIREEVEVYAETDPDAFMELTSNNSIQYRSVIQAALNKQKIVFDPIEYKFTDNMTKQVLAILSPNPAKSHVESFAEWLQANGDKADKIYNRLKETVK